MPRLLSCRFSIPSRFSSSSCLTYPTTPSSLVPAQTDHTTPTAASTYPIATGNAFTACLSSDSASLACRSCLVLQKLAISTPLYPSPNSSAISKPDLITTTTQTKDIKSKPKDELEFHNPITMQSTTTLVNSHNDACPKCGAGISGDTKTCGSCGSVS
jgi:hypothetical protein